MAVQCAPYFCSVSPHKGFTVVCSQVGWGNWAALDSNHTPLPKDTAECLPTALKIGR